MIKSALRAVLVVMICFCTGFSGFCKQYDDSGAINSALKFLAKSQFGNGSWGKENGFETVFALLAFLNNGHLPGKGEYGETIKRGIDYILNNALESGYINISADKSSGAHAIAVILLSSSLGAVKNKDIYKKLEKAVKFSAKNQTSNGGWFNNFSKDDSEIMSTSLQLISMTEVKESGIFIPEETVKKAKNYIKSCRNPNGSYSYQPGNAGLKDSSALLNTSIALSAVLISRDKSEKNRKKADDDDVLKGIQYVLKNSTGEKDNELISKFYSALAVYRAGDSYWERFYPSLRDKVLKLKKFNGSFREDSSNSNEICSTALAALILSIPNSSLPVFVR